MSNAADVNSGVGAADRSRAEYPAISPANSQIATDDKTLPMIAWIAMVFMAPVGVIIAYIDRSKTNKTYATHYQYLIRTFWIGFLFMFISSIFSIVGIGLLMMAATGIWYLIRCVKGFVLLQRGEPITAPTTWLV